jgi:hypothetical protein
MFVNIATAKVVRTQTDNKTVIKEFQGFPLLPAIILLNYTPLFASVWGWCIKIRKKIGREKPTQNTEILLIIVTQLLALASLCFARMHTDDSAH